MLADLAPDLPCCNAMAGLRGGPATKAVLYSPCGIAPYGKGLLILDDGTPGYGPCRAEPICPASSTWLCSRRKFCGNFFWQGVGSGASRS